MKVYNTLTRQKEELKPINEGEYRIYACGPTVYNYIHIGNARPICVFDVLRRYLEYKGNKVIFVQNFTDIDDKIINRANDEGVTFSEISEKYISEYKTDAGGLNVREATIHPKATENIDEIISIIETLIEKGFAYQAGNDVYFSPLKFNEYGKLSHQPLDDLMSGARINVGEIKRESMDFALWKGSKPGEPYWESPWGQGRPGWHIECSAMSRKYLGKTIDIHCGGQDLVFPHHENEIAQSECCNGVPFSNYWMHNGFITVDNEKMSKSKGNFFTVRDVAKQFGYEPIRLLMISCHYRSPINYSYDSLMQCKASLTRLHTCRDSLDFAMANATEEGTVSEEILKNFSLFKNKFCDALDDDLNTADAIGTLFDLVRYINKTVLVEDASKAALKAAMEIFDELTGVLGIVYNENSDDNDEDASEIEALISERTAARKEKNWAKADEIRNKLTEMGIVLEDTPQGVKWHKA
ncbi:MAG: cysteine--tRNA ligase [Clostridia bacterium]|nr:cysteine--tRNA ligase [Clostridia bacterium]